MCDDYRILSLIAGGGMGDVYEAVHDPSGRTVAVKCLKVRHRNKEDARARMKMEAVVLSELQHENLVQVFDAGVNDRGMVWFAMERLHGQTLRDIVFRAGALPIPDALHYASEIADGVDAVHDVNVIHRDLKPENVFVTDDNVVKVLDLGTGKFSGYGLNSTDRMRVIGTTAYMSPEQIKGLRVDARADVYALGLILYEMIAGRHALIEEDGRDLPQGMEQVALRQLQMTPRPLRDMAPACPRYVSTIVERAIAKDREQRFSSMAALSRELRAARKRFVAENQFDGSSPSSGALREKFGAPPRVVPNGEAPRARAPRVVAPRVVAPRVVAPRVAAPDVVEPVLEPLLSAAAGDDLVLQGVPVLAIEQSPVSVPQLNPADDPRDTVAEVRAVVIEGGNDFPTEVRAPLDLTLDGATPPPGYVPTQLLSSSSVPAMPAPLGAATAWPDYPLPPDEVRNQTTRTNPIGFVRAAETPSEDSSDVDWSPRPLFAFWRHPVVRRTAVTLGLGAMIGVPPAVLGVLWSRYQNAPAAAVTAVTRLFRHAPETPIASDPPGAAMAADPAMTSVSLSKGMAPAGEIPSAAPSVSITSEATSMPTSPDMAPHPSPANIAPTPAPSPVASSAGRSATQAARAPRARPSGASRAPSAVIGAPSPAREAARRSDDNRTAPAASDVNGASRVTLPPSGL
jgi:serine/threonine-protein kinase